MLEGTLYSRVLVRETILNTLVTYNMVKECLGFERPYKYVEKRFMPGEKGLAAACGKVIRFRISYLCSHQDLEAGLSSRVKVSSRRLARSAS